MIWLLAAIAFFLAPLLLAAEAIPAAWYDDIFLHARWIGSLSVAFVSIALGFLMTHLQHLLAENAQLGAREIAHRGRIVHHYRIRVAAIALTIFVSFMWLLFLPSFGPNSADSIKPLLAATPFGVVGLLAFMLVSVIFWALQVSKAQVRLIERAEKQRAKEALLDRLRTNGNSNNGNDNPGVIDGHIH